MSDFKTMVKSERTRLQKELNDLTKQQKTIEAQIATIESELQAMVAYEGVAAKVAKKGAKTTTRRAAAKPAATSTRKTAAKPAAKPAAKATAKTTAKAAAKTATRTTARSAAKTTAKPAAKTAAKPAVKAAAKPAAKAAAKSDKPAVAGRRDVILNMIAGRAGGMSRSDLINAMGVKGDKKQEKSISNALADLKRQNSVNLDGGVYKAAGGAAKPSTGAKVLQMPKTASSPSSAKPTKSASNG